MSQKRLSPGACSTPCEFGEAFETYMAHELMAYLDCHHPTEPLHYWRTTSQFEVDFILRENLGVEIKATKNVVPSDLKGLKALKEEGGDNRVSCYGQFRPTCASA